MEDMVILFSWKFNQCMWSVIHSVTFAAFEITAIVINAVKKDIPN